MKRICLIIIVLMLTMSVSAFAEITFLHRFERVDGQSLEERLTADYARGNPVPAVIIQPKFSDGLDVSDSGPVKFGNSAYVGTDNYRDLMLLAYEAMDNVSYGQGSVELWVNLSTDNDNFIAFYVSNHAQNRKIVLMSNSKIGGGRCWWFGRQIEGAASVWVQDQDRALVTNQWQFLAADWKLNSDNPSENYLRFWVDGQFAGEQTYIAKWDSIADEANAWLSVFSRDILATSGLRGYGDDVRITSGAISDIYQLDANNNFTPPTEGFEVPAYADCNDVIRHGWGLSADVIQDCYVALTDFAMIADSWLDCMDPAEAACDF